MNFHFGRLRIIKAVFNLESCSKISISDRILHIKYFLIYGFEQAAEETYILKHPKSYKTPFH